MFQPCPASSLLCKNQWICIQMTWRQLLLRYPYYKEHMLRTEEGGHWWGFRKVNKGIKNEAEKTALYYNETVWQITTCEITCSGLSSWCWCTLQVHLPRVLLWKMNAIEKLLLLCNLWFWGLLWGLKSCPVVPVPGQSSLTLNHRADYCCFTLTVIVALVSSNMKRDTESWLWFHSSASRKERTLVSLIGRYVQPVYQPLRLIFFHKRCLIRKRVHSML